MFWIYTYHDKLLLNDILLNMSKFKDYNQLFNNSHTLCLQGDEGHPLEDKLAGHFQATEDKLASSSASHKTLPQYVQENCKSVLHCKCFSVLVTCT